MRVTVSLLLHAQTLLPPTATLGARDTASVTGGGTGAIPLHSHPGHVAKYLAELAKLAKLTKLTKFEVDRVDGVDKTKWTKLGDESDSLHLLFYLASFHLFSSSSFSLSHPCTHHIFAFA
jgi:hypothetical protein